MRRFRSGWTPLNLGSIVLLSALWLLQKERIPEFAGLSIALGGTLLLMEGALVLRFFPLSLSLARTLEEDGLPEAMLYSLTLGGIRLSFIVCVTLITMVCLILVGKADWLIWCMGASVIGYCVLLIIHAKMAIEKAGNYLIEHSS